MTTNTYIVKSGDTLWDISAKYLGSPNEWPRLWKYNNRKSVIASTGRGITNPDLIYPGQKIALPITGFQDTKSKKTLPKSKVPKPLQQQLKDIKTPFAMQFNLKELVLPPIVNPAAIIEVKMTGNVVLTSKESLPITYVTNNGELEAKATHAANTAFGSLLADMVVNYDNNTGKVKLGMSLIAKSNTPNIPTTSVGIVADSNSPIPKIQYEIKLPELKGNIGDFNYIGANVSINIEVTPKSGSRRDNSPSSNEPIPESPTNFSNEEIALGLVVVASLLIVGTIVEDFFTLGAGVADDPVSFAAAGTMYARAAALWRGATIIAPKALLPVTTRLSITVVPAGQVVNAN